MELQEQIVRKVMPSGNGAHVFAPKAWVGEDVVIVRAIRSSVREKILDVLEPHLGDVKGVYLYGSYARKENDKDSDIDVLVITNEKLKIKKKGFEIICLREEDIEKALKVAPLLLYSALAEAEAIVNLSLLEKLRDKYGLKLNDLKDYINESKRIIEINRELLDPYSIMLRLRGVYIIRSLLSEEKSSNKKFRDWILRNVGDIDYDVVYRSYRRYKEGVGTGDVNEVDLRRLLEFLEKEIDGLFVKLNGKKRKKT